MAGKETRPAAALCLDGQEPFAGGAQRMGGDSDYCARCASAIDENCTFSETFWPTS